MNPIAAVTEIFPRISEIILREDSLESGLALAFEILLPRLEAAGLVTVRWEVGPNGHLRLIPFSGCPAASPSLLASQIWDDLPAGQKAWWGDAYARQLAGSELVADHLQVRWLAEHLFKNTSGFEIAVLSPLILGEDLWGSLIAFYPAGPEDEKGDRIPTQNLLASQLSILIKEKMEGEGKSSISLDQQAEQIDLRRVEELESLFEVAVATTGIFDERQLMDRLYTQIQRILSPDIFVATLVDETQKYLTIVIADENGVSMRETDLTFPIESQSGITGWMLRNRQTVFIRDMLREEPPVPLMQLSSAYPRTWLGVPLIAYDRLVGSIAVQSKQPNAFKMAHVRFLELLSQQIALAIAGARLFQAEAKRREEAEILHRLTSQLLDVTDDGMIFDIGIASVRSYLPQATAVSFSLLDPSQDSLIVLRSWVSDPAFATVKPPQIIPVNSLVVTRDVIEKGRMMVYEDVGLAEGIAGSRLEEFIKRGLKSLLYVPLQIKGRVLGILHIGFWEDPRKFTSSELMTCESIANRIAAALESYRLQVAEREQLKLARTLQEMGAILTTDLTLPQVLERVFDLLARVFPYDTASVQLYDEGEQSLYLAASRGFVETEPIAQLTRKQGLRSLKKFPDGSRIAVIHDTESDPNWVPFEGGEESYVRSWIGAQLVIKGRFIGILNVDSLQPNSFGWDMADTLQAFANQAAVAIESARLYEILNQRVLQLSILHQVALDAAGMFRTADLIKQMTQRIAGTIFPYSFGILLLDGEGEHLNIDENYYSAYGKIEATRVPLEKSLLGHVVRTGKPYVANDVRSDPYYFEVNPQTLSEMAVPILLDGKVIGVINAESPKLNQYSDGDVAFLSTLAGQIATAMHRVQLYEEIQQYAASLSAMVQKRTEELQEERDRLEAILRSAGEGILFTDPNGIIVYANQALVQQSGFTEEELIGSSPNLLGSGTMSPAVFEEMWTTIRAGKRWHGELVNRHKDGKLYDVSLTISPLYDEEDQLRGFVSVQSDITKLKEVERLKSEFVSNVSHELRTPLTNIKTYITLLQKGKPEKRERYFEVLDLETGRLTHLIQDLLDLSRLETGMTEADLALHDLTHVLRQSLDSFSRQIQFTQKTIINQIPDKLPLVWSDEAQIQTVLSNILGNALAYTPTGGTILYAAGVEDDQVWIKIADNGFGIARAEMSRLFDRFFRGKAAERSRTPGTGLGLAIAKEIIVRHRGSIEVDSEIDRGTIFTIWLPISQG